MNTFATLKLPEAMLKNLDDLHYTQMTQIQKESLPFSLKGEDLIAKAKTGSGKTLAFGLPLLLKINVKSFKPQAIVLTPTRELAEQVMGELRKLARFQHNLKIVNLSGGLPMRPQMRSLEHGAHVIVGTPGRIQDHLGKETLQLSSIKTLVLDEADRMLDMGFNDVIMQILSTVSKKRQTLLFSATYEKNIKALSQDITQNPKFVTVEDQEDKPKIKQNFYRCEEGQKIASLITLLQFYQPKSAIIFCNTKVMVKEVGDALYDEGFDALDLHGDLEQSERTETLLQFANGSCRFLVATDMAARGLDIKGIDIVVNYEMPQDNAQYVHRIGRTGRAGAHGVALTLVTPHKLYKVEAVVPDAKIEEVHSLEVDDSISLYATHRTLCIAGGKKNKLRAGDILGALCAGVGVAKEDIGKIDLFDFRAYVGIKKEVFDKVFNGLQKEKIKGRSFRIFTVN
ncbi:MAG: ATP-dependent RNA helicase DbpA [Epsilonproteobacteria bacterium]|nr:ATP-dependent RNA helicase DbpA [Campylobacterota bacterium]